MTSEVAYTLRLAGLDLRESFGAQVSVDPHLVELVEHLLVRFYPTAAACELRKILAVR